MTSDSSDQEGDFLARPLLASISVGDDQEDPRRLFNARLRQARASPKTHRMFPFYPKKRALSLFITLLLYIVPGPSISLDLLDFPNQGKSSVGIQVPKSGEIEGKSGEI